MPKSSHYAKAHVACALWRLLVTAQVPSRHLFTTCVTTSCQGEHCTALHRGSTGARYNTSVLNYWIVSDPVGRASGKARRPNGPRVGEWGVRGSERPRGPRGGPKGLRVPAGPKGARCPLHECTAGREQSSKGATSTDACRSRQRSRRGSDLPEKKRGRQRPSVPCFLLLLEFLALPLSARLRRACLALNSRFCYAVLELHGAHLCYSVKKADHFWARFARIVWSAPPVPCTRKPL